MVLMYCYGSVFHDARPFQNPSPLDQERVTITTSEQQQQQQQPNGAIPNRHLSGSTDMTSSSTATSSNGNHFKVQSETVCQPFMTQLFINKLIENPDAKLTIVSKSEVIYSY